MTNKEDRLKLEPIKRVDILREIIPDSIKEGRDHELKLLCNLRLVPFIINNYDKLFKEKAEKV